MALTEHEQPQTTQIPLDQPELSTEDQAVTPTDNATDNPQLVDPAAAGAAQELRIDASTTIETVLSTDMEEGTEEQQKIAKRGRRVWQALVATTAALTFVAGGVVVGLNAASNTETVSTQKTEDTTPTNPETTQAPSTTEAIKHDDSFIDLASPARPGAEFVNLKFNDRILSIPKLMDPADDPDQENKYQHFATDASRFLSAWWSTGNDELAESFVSSPSVIKPLENTPQNFASYLEAEEGEYSQIAIFSDPEDPAEFSGGSDQYGEFVTLSAGKLYVHPGTFDDPTFNGPETKNLNSILLYPLQELTFWYKKTEAKGIDYEGDVVINRITVAYKTS